MTKYIKFGEENVLAVAADNTAARGMTNFIAETRPGTPPGSNTGVGFQWNTKDFNPIMGGLSRNVKLYVKNDVYQTLPLYSNLKTKGIYVYPTNIDVANASATINVESEVRNESGTDQNVYLEVAVVNHLGELAYNFTSPLYTVTAATDLDQDYLTVVPADAYASNQAAIDTTSREVTVIKASADVAELNLWSVDDPYLYQVFCILGMKPEKDRASQITTGFRSGAASATTVFINDQRCTGYAQRYNEVQPSVLLDWLTLDAQDQGTNANFPLDA